jgi:hypothetical protein
MMKGTNPYNYRTPIEEAECFFGREDYLLTGREFIANRACLSFVGEPRCGLSSLLNRFNCTDFQHTCAESAGPLRFVPVPCEQFDEPLSLVRYLLKKALPDFFLPDIPRWRPLYGRLVSGVRRSEGRLVILFDDFEHIGSNELFVSFIDSLRGLTQAADMTLITATHQKLVDCCHVDVARSPFPNIFDARQLRCFTEDQVRHFLSRTSARSGVDLMPYYEEIESLSGRHPCLLQMACWHYYEVLAGAEGGFDLGRAAEAFAHEAEDVFHRMWEGLDDGEREVVRHLARGNAPGAIPSGLYSKGYVTENDTIFSTAFRDYVMGRMIP